MGAKLRFARRGALRVAARAIPAPRTPPPREVQLRPIARYQVELGNELKNPRERRLDIFDFGSSACGVPKSGHIHSAITVIDAMNNAV